MGGVSRYWITTSGYRVAMISPADLSAMAMWVVLAAIPMGCCRGRVMLSTIVSVIGFIVSTVLRVTLTTKSWVPSVVIFVGS